MRRPTRTLRLAALAPLLALAAAPAARAQSVQGAGPDEPVRLDVIKPGASMEDVAKLKDPAAKTPEEAIRRLVEGNARFFGGQAQRPELNANERRSQIAQQTPFAVVLGCSDSRVPVEIVFDQGLGDLFLVRVAGHVVSPAGEGSIEYGIKHLKSRVLVVLGHEGCGAVQAAMLDDAAIAAEPANVQYLLRQIGPAVRGLPPIRDDKARMREAVMANVRLQVAELKQNPVVAEAVQAGQIAVIGAFYEISSGAVDFLITDEQLAVDPPRPGGDAADGR